MPWLPLKLPESAAKVAAAAGGADHEAAAAAGLEQIGEEDWHQVAGKRFARATEFLSQKAKRFHVFLFALVTEPLRFLTAVFLHVSCWAGRSRPPLVFDLVGKGSTNVMVRQYYSSVLRGRASRLRLLTFMFKDMREPELLFIRRAVMVADAAVYRRHQVYLRDWEHFGLADCRRTEDNRLQIIRAALERRACCCRPGLLRDLRRDGLGLAADSRARQARQALDRWSWPLVNYAWQLRLSIADIERCRARNRRRAHPQRSFSVMAARFLSGELRNRRDTIARLQQEVYAEARKARAPQLAAAGIDDSSSCAAR